MRFQFEDLSAAPVSIEPFSNGASRPFQRAYATG
jgi:hypothetical protein